MNCVLKLKQNYIFLHLVIYIGKKTRETNEVCSVAGHIHAVGSFPKNLCVQCTRYSYTEFIYAQTVSWK